jgi:uncharacterized protein (TIGR02246 family)
MDNDGAQMDNDEALRVLTERLRRLEDLEEIRQLYTEYGRRLDGGDAVGYAELFSADAKLRLGGVMRGNGRAEIEQAVTKLLKSMEAADRSVHVIGAPVIDLQGDTANGESVWVAYSQPAAGAPGVLVGRHVDQLVREDGRWRFALRRGLIDVGLLGPQTLGQNPPG